MNFRINLSSFTCIATAFLLKVTTSLDTQVMVHFNPRCSRESENPENHLKVFEHHRRIPTLNYGVYGRGFAVRVYMCTNY